MDLDATLDRWALGLIPPEDLPDLATEAIQAGWDSESLIRLAGLSPFDARDARELFQGAIAELGWQGPTVCDAMWRTVRAMSAEIVAGKLRPDEGAFAIWRLVRSNDFRSCPDVARIAGRFAALAAEFDYSKDAALLGAITEAARSLTS